MNTVILVCAVAVTLAFVVLVTFAVRTLMQVYNTAKQAELLLTSINQEITVVSHITAAVGQFFANSFPMIKYVSLVSGLVSGWFMKRKNHAQV